MAEWFVSSAVLAALLIGAHYLLRGKISARLQYALWLVLLVRLLLPVAIVAALYLLWRIARNLEKPPKLTEEVKIVRKSLSETLKENRTRCKMTQEFVAETIGVSRQAVSKWENGVSLR